MATSILSPIDELSTIEPGSDVQEHNIHTSSFRENALSIPRPYSPSAASTIGTTRLPSLFTLDIGRPNTWDEPTAQDKSRQPSRFNWQNPLARKPTSTIQPLNVPVRLLAGNDQRKWDAVAMLDPHSTCNLVSTQTVEKQALDVEWIDKLHFANTTSGEPMYCLGYIDIRLYCSESEGLVKRGFLFQPKFYEMRFLVVESSNFDVIVGHRTMDQEDIYKNDDLISER